MRCTCTPLYNASSYNSVLDNMADTQSEVQSRFGVVGASAVDTREQTSAWAHWPQAISLASCELTHFDFLSQAHEAQKSREKHVHNTRPPV